MLSGNGRHRRPRHAPAFLVTAGVTSAGLALPLLGAGAAQAVTGQTWDEVAECESGGVWSADTGNGYYGGLQLPLALWQEYGGTEFADRPDLASRSQQVAVAERVVADQGPRAFPTCALSSGLWSELRETEPETGETGDADEADASGESGGPGEPDGSGAADGASDTSDASDPAGSAGTSDSSDATDEPAASDATDAGADGTGGGRHRGAQDPEEAERGAADSDGRHADRGRTGEGEAADSYQVRPGDSLSAIAAEQNVAGGWPALYEENETVIGDNPDHILPGQRLDVDVTSR